MKLHTHSLRWIAHFLLAAVLLQALAPAWAGARGSADKPLLEILLRLAHNGLSKVKNLALNHRINHRQIIHPHTSTAFFVHRLLQLIHLMHLIF